MYRIVSYNIAYMRWANRFGFRTILHAQRGTIESAKTYETRQNL